MGNKVNYSFLLKLLLLLVFSLVIPAYGQNEEPTPLSKTNLQDKYYRQALYHYFQDDAAKALSQVEQNKARLGQLDSRAALFEAGLQLSAGLLSQAKSTLVSFDDLLAAEKQNAEENTEAGEQKSAKANELRLIALLSLTSQYLTKGHTEQAKDSLAKIDAVPATYYQEYHVLNQLAFWPEHNSELLAKPEDSQNENSAYVQLNEALRLIELAQFEPAIKALNTIKITDWHDVEENFWKTLFIDDANYSSQNNQRKMAALQEQAIQDYAQLLLSQIYISQERYNLAFNELKAFPEQSPYAESALFLFAFASQQVEQHDIALSLLGLLYKKYPYSQLSWQSAELMAQLVSDQRSLAQGVSAYQTVEGFFLQQQKDLNAFATAFNKSGNLLEFSQENPIASHERENSKHYLPRSMWLQQALYDAELTSLYQSLIDIDEQTAELKLLLDKTVWIGQIITLNQDRKQNIIAQQKKRDEQGIFEQLKRERQKLATLLNQQLTNEQSPAFANEDERLWLKRIARSHKALQEIDDKKDTEEYKERLARVESVLTWQLTQQYPARAWRFTKQLQQLDTAIADVIKQQQNVKKISNTQGSLELRITEHKQSVSKLNSLLVQLAQLREKISVKVRAKVNHYIDEQHVIIAEHVLSTRQAMAKVLERMASADKRLSLKLTPSNNLAETTNTSENMPDKTPALTGVK